ncbi:hypothetical protein WA026_001179 [Henosepilachna vigintioctopunctata]|uniref:Uncharacterized protein n=1 Tax=Henosepilachna vigintioctopunctata TaxID=420089 RepID=A0AAW1USL5_9CUCU
MSSSATDENKAETQIKPTEVPPIKEQESPAPPNVATEQTTRKIEEEQDTSNGSIDKYTMNMEGLSDSDLQTLLQNFKDLSTEEQHGLINYLKKLEAKEPERVEKLRKFVNLTENVEEKTDNSGRYSPFSNRSGSLNPAPVEEIPKTEDTSNSEKKEEQSAFVNIDSEDEDYSFEDVAKAASQKVIEKEMEMKRREEETKKENEDKNINDAKALITTLMNSLNKGTTRVSSTNVSATGSPSIVQQASSIVQPSDGTISVDAASISEEPKQSISTGKINIISNVPVSSADLAKSLSGITMSMSSLGSILGNVQNLTRQQAASSVSELEPKISHNSQPPSVKDTVKSNVRNLYDDFDIGSQKEVRGSSNFSDQPKNSRPTKSYDEFNIGPNPEDIPDEVVDPRGAGRSGPPQRGYENKPIGYPERGGMPQNAHSLDRGQPYAPSGGAFRGNVGGPSPTMSAQSPYPSRGGNPTNNMRPNNFDTRGDFGMDRGDFRAGPNDSRGGMGDFRSGPNDMRGGVNDMRGGVDVRSLSRSHGDLRGAPQGELRSGLHGEMRGGPHGDFRSEYRDGHVDFRGGSDFRANDFRMDSRGPPGNFRGGFDDMRSNSVDSRGGLSRGGPPPMRGMMSDPSRLGNSGPSRYSGNYAGNGSNSFKRW